MITIALGSTRARFALAVFALVIPAQVSAVEQWQLWKINADGSGLALFAAPPDYSCHSPRWSPDGTEVAFDVRHPGEEIQASQVAVIHADGTGFRILGPGGMPGWSPDGKQCVFHTYGVQNIVVMNLDGTGRETLLNNRGCPRWLPEGNRIALMGLGGGLAIFDLATGKEHSISNIHSVYPGFGFTRDGLRLCYGEYTGGVFLATFDKQSTRATVSTITQSGRCYGASWSPDGKQVVYCWKSVPKGTAGTPESSHQLYKLAVDAGAQPMLFPGQDTTRNNKNPDWSPDGKTIIFSSQARK